MLNGIARDTIEDLNPPLHMFSRMMLNGIARDTIEDLNPPLHMFRGRFRPYTEAF